MSYIQGPRIFFSRGLQDFRVDIHTGKKKSPKFESGLDQYFLVRVSQNSSPKFFYKKESKLKLVWKVLLYCILTRHIS